MMLWIHLIVGLVLLVGGWLSLGKLKEDVGDGVSLLGKVILLVGLIIVISMVVVMMKGGML